MSAAAAKKKCGGDYGVLALRFSGLHLVFLLLFSVIMLGIVGLLLFLTNYKLELVYGLQFMNILTF